MVCLYCRSRISLRDEYNSPTPDFFDTDGRPVPAETAGRKLKIRAVLSALKQGLMAAAEACAAYGSGGNASFPPATRTPRAG